MPPHSRKTAEGPPIEMSEYDETRATARLPNLDIEILHRRPWEGNEEHLMVTLRGPRIVHSQCGQIRYAGG